nr:succinate dehydrogenase assembly factor 2 [uncultured Albidiferax sp.]
MQPLSPSTEPVAPAGSDLLGERALSKLRWRCRRGLLENDLYIDRFFQKFADTLTVSQGQAMLDLMDLSDNDLLDLHLARKPLAEVEPALDRSDVHEVLSMLRNR